MFNGKSDLIEVRYTEEEARRELGFKTRITMYRLRRKGKIGYYDIGGKIFYGRHHLADYLASCERKARTRGARAEV